MVSYSLPQIIANHKYYGRCYQKAPSNFSTADSRFEYFNSDATNNKMTFGSFSNSPYDNDWHLLSSILSLSSPATASYQLRAFSVNGTQIAYRKELMIIDLTAAYGFGNEPTQAWCDANIPYFVGTYSISNSSISLKNGDIINCPYSGSIKSINLPKGTYKLETWGAQGGGPNTSSYSSGGYSYGTYTISGSTTLYLISGGAGGYNTGGYNGGGGIASGTYTYGGGGATHIGLKSGLLTSFSSDYTSKLLLVAGGGGGGRQNGNNPSAGGVGGGTSGGTGGGDSSYLGGGATQTAGGAGKQGGQTGTFGQGGAAGDSRNNSSCFSGAGGGGFYGGGGGGTGSGWFTNYSGSGGGGSGYINSSLASASTNQGYTVSNPGSSNGYIRITVISVVIKITYNANGGSSTPSIQEINPGTSVVLAGAISRNNNNVTITLSGNGNGGTNTSTSGTKTITYTFAGWNTNSSGTGTNYSASQSATFSDNITLYAKWTESTSYSGNYHINQIPIPQRSESILPFEIIGNGNPAVNTSTTGKKVTQYTFSHWNTAANGSGTSYQSTDSTALYNNTTLYAQWTSNIIYRDNKVSDLPIPTRQKYNFIKWATNADGSGTSYQSNSSSSFTSAITLYAQWERIKEYVPYIYTGGQWKLYKTSVFNSSNWKNYIGSFYE